MTAFATAQELKTYLDGGTLDGSPGTDDAWISQAELFLDLVSADIQTAARNRIIAGTDVELKLAGTWNRDLELPLRPVTAVSSVEVNGVAIGSTAFEWNERQLVRRYSGFGQYSDLEHLAPEDGAHWGGPESTVTIVLSYGYTAETVPVVVKALALRVAARAIGNPTGVSQESLGAYSVSYGSVLTAGGSHLTDAEVKMIRKRFASTAGTITAGSL